jgi:hypothetical protein
MPASTGNIERTMEKCLGRIERTRKDVKRRIRGQLRLGDQ